MPNLLQLLMQRFAPSGQPLTPAPPPGFSGQQIDTDPAAHNVPPSNEQAASRFGSSYEYRRPGDNRHFDTPAGLEFTRNDDYGNQQDPDRALKLQMLRELIQLGIVK